MDKRQAEKIAQGWADNGEKYDTRPFEKEHHLVRTAAAKTYRLATEKK